MSLPHGDHIPMRDILSEMPTSLWLFMGFFVLVFVGLLAVFLRQRNKDTKTS